MELISLKEAAKLLNIKANTIRYWAKSREKELGIFFCKIPVIRKGREIKMVFIKDIQEFKKKYNEIRDTNRKISEKKKEYQKGLIVWTDTAKECYSNNCNCSICSLWEIACKKAAEKRKIPPLKILVIKILNILGEPGETKNV